MKRLIIKLFLSLCLWAVLPVCAQDAVHYYFRTMDIRNGLSQNTVYQIWLYVVRNQRRSEPL